MYIQERTGHTRPNNTWTCSRKSRKQPKIAIDSTVTPSPVICSFPSSIPLLALFSNPYCIMYVIVFEITHSSRDIMH